MRYGSIAEPILEASLAKNVTTGGKAGNDNISMGTCKLAARSRKRLGKCFNANLTLERPFDIGCQLESVNYGIRSDLEYHTSSTCLVFVFNVSI
jgi:hypothetical protein